MSIGVAPSTTGTLMDPPCCCPGRGPNARYTFRIYWRVFGTEPPITPEVWWAVTAEGVGISVELRLANEFRQLTFNEHVDAGNTWENGFGLEDDIDTAWCIHVEYDDGEPPDGEEGILPPRIS